MISAPPFTLSSVSSEPVPFDFTFEIDDEKYMCHSSQLRCISTEIPEGTNYWKLDKIKDPHHTFRLIMNLISGRRIHIDTENCYFLHKVGEILGIRELIEKSRPFEIIDITIDNVFDLAINLYEHNLDFTKARDFMVIHFNELKENQYFLSLPVGILNSVLDSPNFPLKGDQLFEWVKNIVDTQDREYSLLYSHCNMTNLSHNNIKSVIDSIAYDTIPLEAWLNFGDRLDMSVDNKEEEDQEIPQPQPQANIWANAKITPTPTPPPSYSSEQAPVFNKNSLPERAKTFSPNPVQSFQSQYPSLLKTGFQPTVTQPSNSMQHSPYQAIQPKVVVPLTTTDNVYDDDEEDEEEDLFYEDDMDDDDDDEIYLPYADEYCLNGIIKYMRDAYGWNYSKYIITSGGGTKTNKLQMLFDYDHLNKWWDNYDGNKRACTKDNAWFQIQFVNHSVILESYTLVSTAEKPRMHQPRSWIIKVSNDGNKWETADTRTNCTEMNVPTPKLTFKLKTPTKPISYIKFVMTQNHSKEASNAYELSLGAFEVYGKLIQLY